MNFTDLEIFKAVVDEGGIIKASRKLHRVPSSVTSRIQQLESSMGVSLFHRDRQRLHLSPTGELLRGYADRLIQLSEEARSVVSGAKPQGVLKLGTLESTAASRLPGLLTDFHRLYPDVRLELVDRHQRFPDAGGGRSPDRCGLHRRSAGAVACAIPGACAGVSANVWL